MSGASSVLELQPGVAHLGWKNHLRLRNRTVEVLLSTEYGPRVVGYAARGGENILAELPPSEEAGSGWQPYGGHRLWHAPEHPVRTYQPDNNPLQVDVLGAGAVRLTQQPEPLTRIQKSIEVTLNSESSRVTLVHRLVNQGLFEIRLAAWALTVLRTGGRAFFPHAPHRDHPEALLPVAPLVVWAYTDMSDPRWTWGRHLFELRQDPARSTPQKIGYLNTRGWAAYLCERVLFLKRYPCLSGVEYPDLGCNTETFTNDRFIEVESLGPLTTLAPGAGVTHVEDWHLFVDVDLGADERDRAAALQSLVAGLARIGEPDMAPHGPEAPRETRSAPWAPFLGPASDNPR